MTIDRRHWIRQVGVAGAGLFASCCGCQSVPLTGRQQFIVFPESQELELGAAAYEAALANEQVSTNAEVTRILQQTGSRIANVSQRPAYRWEFRLIASPAQNAFCLPGGKVAVYEGILPVCKNEAGLAVVLSHEVAHALARHGGERMSQNLAINGGREVFDRVLQVSIPDRRQQLLQAYGLASEYGVILPYSRQQETEADQMGVMLMAQAGYDPAESTRFWRRFAQLSNPTAAPEFLSTHPSDQRRIIDLNAWMDQAMQAYARAPQQWGLGRSLTS